MPYASCLREPLHVACCMSLAVVRRPLLLSLLYHSGARKLLAFSRNQRVTVNQPHFQLHTKPSRRVGDRAFPNCHFPTRPRQQKATTPHRNDTTTKRHQERPETQPTSKQPCRTRPEVVQWQQRPTILSTYCKSEGKWKCVISRKVGKSEVGSRKSEVGSWNSVTLFGKAVDGG